MFKFGLYERRVATASVGATLAAVSIVAGVFLFGDLGSSPAGTPPTVGVTGSSVPLPLRPMVLPELAAKGLELPKEMALYEPSALDASSTISKDSAIASAQGFYPPGKLGDAQLVLMTDDLTPAPRLVWVVTVNERPVFVNGPAGAPGPDATRPAYWLVFVDAHTGEAMFGQSGEKG